MDLKSRIEEAAKTALRSKQRARREALNLILAAIKQLEIDTRKPLEESEILGVLNKLGKQRRESIKQFSAAGRNDLVESEQKELELIEEFLPPPLSKETIGNLIDEAISKTGARDIRDMGKVMNELRSKLQGRTDMSIVSADVKSRLSQ
ncbi:GatB/YqeY domain-containing protein [Acidihalobacter prosperus]